MRESERAAVPWRPRGSLDGSPVSRGLVVAVQNANSRPPAPPLSCARGGMWANRPDLDEGQLWRRREARASTRLI